MPEYNIKFSSNPAVEVGPGRDAYPAKYSLGQGKSSTILPKKAKSKSHNSSHKY